MKPSDPRMVIVYMLLSFIGMFILLGWLVLEGPVMP